MQNAEVPEDAATICYLPVISNLVHRVSGLETIMQNSKTIKPRSVQKDKPSSKDSNASNLDQNVSELVATPLSLSYTNRSVFKA